MLLSNQVWANSQNAQLKIGSKKFTEAVIIGEILKFSIEQSGVKTEHLAELGGTRLLWNSLINGEIDVYADYTGTIRREIFKNRNVATDSDLPQILKEYNIKMTGSLGFNNTYVLGIKQTTAQENNIFTISDLRQFPEFELGFTNEFMDRADGWPGLKDFYQLPHKNVRGLDHDLAYRGLENGSIRVTDMYATDAEIEYYKLRSLEDDLKFFPSYQAAVLYREDLADKFPDVIKQLNNLEGLINETEMIKMNADAKLNRIPESTIAAQFLTRKFGWHITEKQDTLFDTFWRHTLDHLFLVLISLSAAIIFAIPLGVLSAKNEKVGQIILGVVGIIQTIPSLALLVFMIPLLGIGGPPAIVALFLYSLLPIVRNTYTGIHDIATPIRESAEALGLPAFARLLLIELPLASRAILAGIKTSAVINVGTATLGALIGAGGYGQPILTGIRLDDIGLILQGAVPAALLALIVQGGFDLAERIFVPKGLRLKIE